MSRDPNVIQIADLRLRRKQRVYEEKRQCEHLNLTIDRDGGDLLYCDDCNRQVPALWVLEAFLERYRTERRRRDLDRDVLVARINKLETDLQVMKNGWKQET